MRANYNWNFNLHLKSLLRSRFLIFIAGLRIDLHKLLACFLVISFKLLSYLLKLLGLILFLVIEFTWLLLLLQYGLFDRGSLRETSSLISLLRGFTASFFIARFNSRRFRTTVLGRCSSSEVVSNVTSIGLCINNCGTFHGHQLRVGPVTSLEF